MIPTNELFGLAPAYLLLRDDGALRVLRLGHARLESITSRKELALYSTEHGQPLRATRRRGAPIRHYETPAADVQRHLHLLTQPARSAPADETRKKPHAWLRRLGRSEHQTLLYATLSMTPPDRLAGLVAMLDGNRDSDARVSEQLV